MIAITRILPSWSDPATDASFKAVTAGVIELVAAGDGGNVGVRVGLRVGEAARVGV